MLPCHVGEQRDESQLRGMRRCAQVRGDPGTVLKLRCLFLKLRSLLEVPLLRLGQARSPALAPTSRVYSSALVAFARRLLQASFPPRSLRCLHGSTCYHTSFACFPVAVIAEGESASNLQQWGCRPYMTLP